MNLSFRIQGLAHDQRTYIDSAYFTGASPTNSPRRHPDVHPQPPQNRRFSDPTEARGRESELTTAGVRPANGAGPKN